MRINLTDVSVRALKPGDTQFKVWDKSTPGFGVLVGGRTKSFIVMFGRKRHLKTIGRYPATSVADARKIARRFLLEPEPSSLRFGEAFETYVEMHLKPNNRPRTATETERLIRKHFSPLFRRPLVSVKTGDISRICDDLLHAPSAANHAFAAVRGFLRWATRRRYIPYSPLDGLQPPAKSAPRDRVLSDDELRAVWTAAEQMGSFGAIVRLLIATGQRRGEIAELRSSWMNGNTITLPASVTKNGREHTFPLGSLALSILNPAPEPPALFFPARGKSSPFNGWSKSKTQLDKLSGVSGWTLHDLRRTYASNMARVGVSLPVIEKLLNHVSGSFAGIVGVYQKHSYAKEMQEAVALYDGLLLTMLAHR